MDIQQHISLTPYNTFGIDAIADFFVTLNNMSDLHDISSAINSYDKFLVIGGGSNLLITQSYNGLVVRNALKGIELVKEDQHHVWVKALAGEVWHDLVLYAVENNWGGIENLSLIPGCVGAAPMQNIGAYGVELRDCFVLLEAYHIKNQEVHVFDAEDCAFGYRDSVFKNELRDEYIILSVTLKLNKDHKVNTDYGAIQDTLNHITDPTIRQVSDAVIEIRSAKLPDPKVIGNSGSFFKNPVIPNALFEKIKMDFPQMPNYPVDDVTTKVPAGWLIEQCGWKGKIVGNTGTYKNQALVLVNHGGATGKEILALSKQIQASVLEQFNIALQPEVNII